MIVLFNSRNDAVSTVPKLLQDGRIPLAIEYVEKDLMEKTAKHIGEAWPPVKEGSCYLLIIEAESNRDQVLSESLRIAEICKENGSLEPLLVEPIDEQNRILRIRSSIYSTLKPNSVDILDTVVPPVEIGKLMDAVDKIAKKYNTYIPVYGHVGDGNLHEHIMKEKGNVPEFVEKLRDEIYEAAMKLNGVITAEHGIGKVRVGKISHYLDETQIELMRKIKKVFDPNNILNPGTKITIEG